MADVDQALVQEVTQIARSVRMLAGWVVFAIILSIVGGIIMGVQYSQQQDRLQRILNGDSSSSDCSDPATALYDPNCP